MKLTIIYYSQTGNTEAMAEAVAKGAKETGAQVNLKKALDFKKDDILSADAVVFGSPNYFGDMAGAIQMVLEKTFVEMREEKITMPFAVFASAGSRGGQEPASRIEEICSHFGGKFGNFNFRKAAEAVTTPPTPPTQSPVGQKISSETLTKCEELGRRMASL
jgi:multimeric flavodoxin WrbA